MVIGNDSDSVQPRGVKRRMELSSDAQFATIVLIGVLTGIYSAGSVNAVYALLSGCVLFFCSGVALASSAGGSMCSEDENRLERLGLGGLFVAAVGVGQGVGVMMAPTETPISDAERAIGGHRFGGDEL